MGLKGPASSGNRGLRVGVVRTWVRGKAAVCMKALKSSQSSARQAMPTGGLIFLHTTVATLVRIRGRDKSGSSKLPKNYQNLVLLFHQ